MKHFNIKPELISFKLCPFVQRAAIMLHEKQIDFDVTYIDLANKPDWFLKLSPFGKVPVLKYDNDVIFESAVICEFLNEQYPPSLHPTDTVQRAHNRAWIEFGSTLLMSLYRMKLATDEAGFVEAKSETILKLDQLNEQTKHTPFFNGEQFCIIDAAFAPVFIGIAHLETIYPLSLLSQFPTLQVWSRALLERPSIKASIVDNYSTLAMDALKSKNSYILKLAEQKKTA